MNDPWQDLENSEQQISDRPVKSKSPNVHITQHNLERILMKRCHLSALGGIDEEIWKSRLDIFNRLELNQLRAFIALLKDSEDFFDNIWLPLPKVKDDYQWLHPPKQPAYHDDPECSGLLAHYDNFKVPESIRKKGKGEVEKFRKWFKGVDGENMMKKERNKFDSLLAQQWGPGVVHEFNAEVGNRVEGKNSGETELQGMVLEELEGWINNHLDLARSFWRTSNEHSDILYRMVKMAYQALHEAGFQNRTRYPDEKVRQILKEFHTKYKIPLINSLLAYYRKTHNPDLSISRRVLEHLNFRPCKMCAQGMSEYGVEILH